MKWIKRIVALPIALFVGALLWALLHLSIYNSLPIFPLVELLLTLSPGMLIGAILSFYVPGLFIWFLTWEFDGELESVSLESSASELNSGYSEPESDEICKNSKQNK